MTELALSTPVIATVPPIVWLGSLGSSTAMWDRQVAAFAATHRCVLIDHPGHGASPPSEGPLSIAEASPTTCSPPSTGAASKAAADFVGLSLGAMVAISIAADHPARVDRLALLCTSAHFDSPEPWHERAATVRADGTGAVAETIVGRWLTPEYAAAHPDEVATFVAMITADDVESYASCCEADRRDGPAAVAAAHRLRPPSSIVGTLDPATPPHHGETIAAGIAGSRLRAGRRRPPRQLGTQPARSTPSSPPTSTGGNDG